LHGYSADTVVGFAVAYVTCVISRPRQITAVHHSKKQVEILGEDLLQNLGSELGLEGQNQDQSCYQLFQILPLRE